jgi:hypothetical protein
MEHHRDEIDPLQQGVQAEGADADDDLFGQADQADEVGGPEERVDEQLQAERDEER